MKRSSDSLLTVATIIWIIVAVPCSAQLRIVTYNTTPTLNDGLSLVLASIGSESINGIARPVDILALQEKTTQAVETQAVVDLLNAIYGPETYARGNLNGAGFFTQGIVYNTNTVELIAEKRVGTVAEKGAARQSLRYRFRPVGYDDTADFYIYNAHLKANDTQVDADRRGIEVLGIRADAELLGPDANVIYLGDLNVYRDTEPAFQSFIEPGVSQAFDPINRLGRWNKNGQFVDVHTQSTTVRGGENRAGGGMNDRFDFQLLTLPLLDGEGLSYIGPHVPNLAVLPASESYRALGNNGTHFRDRDISTGTGAAPEILAALESASDHLPVVVDYQLPAKMEMEVDYPKRIIVGADVAGILRVSNVAPVDVSIGADELDYSVSSLAGIAINEQGVAIASRLGNEHRFQIPAGSIGSKSQVLVASSSSAEVANRLIQETVSYEVLEHARGSFESVSIVDSLELDLGSFPVAAGNETISFDVTIHNLETAAGLTSDLRVGTVELSNSPFEISIPETFISAGEFRTFQGGLNLSRSGHFRVDVEVPTSDELLPGSAAGTPLSISLLATVVGRLLGDFNDDGLLSTMDIDLLTAMVRSQVDMEGFDLNQDGQLDQFDRVLWIETLKNTYFGDANLDGQFDSTDFVTVFSGGEYRDAKLLNSTWSTGDWDGDGEFDTSDLILAFQTAGYDQGHREEATVPEPATLSVVWFVLIAVLLYARSN